MSRSKVGLGRVKSTAHSSPKPLLQWLHFPGILLLFLVHLVCHSWPPSWTLLNLWLLFFWDLRVCIGVVGFLILHLKLLLIPRFFKYISLWTFFFFYTLKVGFLLFFFNMSMNRMTGVYVVDLEVLNWHPFLFCNHSREMLNWFPSRVWDQSKKVQYLHLLLVSDQVWIKVVKSQIYTKAGKC